MALGKYLRRLYFDGELVRESYDLFPADIGHWLQSIEKDKRDGYITTYRTKPSKTGLTRYVSYAKSVPVDCKHHYYTFTLVGFDYPGRNQRKV